MENKFVILGNFLGKNIVGLTRMGYEYLLQIDKFANEFDIVLLVPEGFSRYANDIKNIPIVEKGKPSSKWTSTVATKYAYSSGRRIINLTFPFSLNKHSIVEIADVRYLERINGKYFDSFKFRFLMHLKAFIGSRNADVVATISNFSKERICKLLHVSEDKIRVIPCGWEHITKTAPDYNIFKKYSNLKYNEFYFTLGSLARHKNHKLIIELAENNPDKVFVIGGGIDPQIFYKDCSVDNKDNIIFTGMLTDGEIKALYKECKAFIFPSLYEGFGIPPLEAMACGAKVIVSNIPVLKEIFNDSVYYINPTDPSICLSDVLQAPVEDEKCVLEEYSWDNAGIEWHKLLKSIGDNDEK